jgi:hypothetical protein
LLENIKLSNKLVFFSYAIAPNMPKVTLISKPERRANNTGDLKVC